MKDVSCLLQIAGIMQEWSDDDSGAELAALQLPIRQKRTDSIVTAGQEAKEGG